MRIKNLISAFLLLTGVSYSQVVVKGRIDHVVPDGVDTLGNIYLTVTGGTSPYTYTWTPGGSNVKDLTNANMNSYTVNVKDNASATAVYKYKLGYKTYWTNFISCSFKNDTIFGSTVNPYYPVSGWNTSISRATLKSSTDGWVQWVVGSTGYQIMLGFIDSVTIGSTGLYSDIDYGIYQNGVNFNKVVAGVPTSVTSVASGDVLRMERTGTTLTFLKNGTTINTFTVSTSKDWKLKVAMQGGYSHANIGANFMDSTSSNFPNYVEDIPNITHCTPGSSNGSIKLSPRISGSTHNYTWSPGGATTPSISSLSVGNYSVDIKDANSNISKYNYNIGYKTYWTNFLGTKLQRDTLLLWSPTLPTGWNTTLSKNTLLASTDGWVEFVAKSQAIWYMVGLLDSASSVAGVYYDIDYGVYMLQNKIYRVIGGAYTLINSFQVGDVIRLERTGSTFYLKVNGYSVYSTSCTSSALKIKTVINAGTVSNIGASFYDTTGVNFPTYVEDIPLIVHTTPGSSNGSIKLTPKISGTTHNYTWTPGGATTSSITGLSNSNYAVTIKDADNNKSNYYYNVGYKTYWTDFYGLKFRRDSLQFASPTSPSGWNSALSKNTLVSGASGWVEFVAKSYSDVYMIGFLDSASAVAGIYQDIDFGVYMNGVNLYKVYAGGLTFIGAFKVGDVVRIDRTGSTYNLKLNGFVVSSVGASSGINLKVKAVLNNVSVSNIGASFADTTNTYFANYVENFPVIYNTSGEELGTGSVQLFGKDVSPNTYTWSVDGTNESSIINRGYGPYTVVSKDVSGNSSFSKHTINYKQFWTNLSAMSVQNDSLFSITPYNSSGYSTATSYDSLPQGQNGGLEFIVNNVNSGLNYIIGLIDAPTVANQVTDIDYGIKMYYYNIYRYVNGSTLFLGYARDGDKISIERSGSTISYKLNGYTLNSYTTTVSSSWKVKTGITSGQRVPAPGSSVSPIKVQVSKPHAVLKKTMDNGYYMAYNAKIYFTFDGEYNSSNLTYNIYDFTHSSVTGCTSLIKNPGDNRYLIDLNSCTSTSFGYVYVLEVSNEKNEKYYLRFMRN